MSRQLFNTSKIQKLSEVLKLFWYNISELVPCSGNEYKISCIKWPVSLFAFINRLSLKSISVHIIQVVKLFISSAMYRSNRKIEISPDRFFLKCKKLKVSQNCFQKLQILHFGRDSGYIFYMRCHILSQLRIKAFSVFKEHLFQ